MPKLNFGMDIFKGINHGMINFCQSQLIFKMEYTVERVWFINSAKVTINNTFAHFSRFHMLK